jgi:hypothetical protein
MIKRPQIVDTIPTNIRSNVSSSPKKDYVNLESKLQRLEQLQYALTKQVIHFFYMQMKFFSFVGIRKSKTSTSGRD